MSVNHNSNSVNLQNKKIAVIGIGGVGGYLAGMLASRYPHVTFAARGKRLESIKKHGLTLHSDYHGKITAVPEHVVPVEELEEQDCIFVCVKNYSLEEVCRSMKHAVSDHTLIIPVMNGVDPGERVRTILTKGTVIDSLIYIIAFANPDFSISQQGSFAQLYLGIRDADCAQREAVNEAVSILAGADIDCKAAEDIEQAIWKKYILNCAYNVTTACYDNTIGQIRNDPVKAGEYEALVKEAYQVALARHVHITQEHIDSIIHRFYYEYADNATSSLQRDVRAGKTNELETFSGYLVREAARLGVPVPVSERMYQILKEQTQSHIL